MMPVLCIKILVWESDYTKIISWHSDQISCPGGVKQNYVVPSPFYLIFQLAFK